MSSEDYLIRYFQQLAKVLAALMGLYDKKKYQLAVDEINQVLDTWFNLPEEKLDKLSAEELDEVLQNTDGKYIELAKSVAELLYQKSINLIGLNKNEEAITNAQKALALFKIIDQKSGDFSIDIQQRIAELDHIG